MTQIIKTQVSRHDKSMKARLPPKVAFGGRDQIYLANVSANPSVR